MKKKSRRKSHVIRLLLVFLMLFTMMPASIFAFADMDYSSDQQEDKAGNSRVKDDSVIVNEYEDGFRQTILWIDNNDEAGIRSTEGNYPEPVLEFSVDGGAYNVLDSTNMKEIGLKQMPKSSINVNYGVGSYSVSYGGNTLPSKVTYTDQFGKETEHLITWKVKPSDVEGYSVVDVTEENIQTQYPSASETGPGWYYVLENDFSFHIQLRRGDMIETPGISNAILNDMELEIVTSKDRMIYPLREIQNNLKWTVDEGEDLDNPSKGTLTISEGWKYNLDGSLIVYSVQELESKEESGIILDCLEEGDRFVLSYDNVNAPGYGAVTDRVHNGGTMYWTLSGEVDYQATKVWLDAAMEDANQKRPTGEFQLWRYRKGSDYTSAAAVRNEEVIIISVYLDPTEDQFKIDIPDLPKYDSEGYEYIYVVREYLNDTTLDGEKALGYEQVFGSVEADGTYQDRVDVNGDVIDVPGEDQNRDSGNIYLYNGGTLSNRLSGTVSVPATKVWKAAAFQSAFEGVEIELTLQRRAKGSEDPWQNTLITQIMNQFTAENLSGVTMAKTVPKYDEWGRELEYRWVETGVFQNDPNREKNLFQPDSDGGGTFILTQADREVIYQSVTNVQEGMKSEIINSIKNTITYEIEKEWAEGITPTPVNFYLYRSVSGDPLGQAVAKVEMDGTADGDSHLVNEDLGIYAEEKENWTAVFTNLREFDEEGRQYEYILLEGYGNGAFIPSYDTVRTDKGYLTKVINGPGEDNRIMVRKEWTDDSDIFHRELVEVTVYNRQTNEEVNTVTLGEHDVWVDWVSIGKLKPEEVYILETKVGTKDVPLQDYNLNDKDPANYDEPKLPIYVKDSTEDYTAIQFQATNHKYEATYDCEVIEGVTFYTATNRRLGNINLTVTKDWYVGDSPLRDEIKQELERIKAEKGIDLVLALQLNFMEEETPPYYEITRSGIDVADSVMISSKNNQVPILDSQGNPESSIQAVDLDKDTSTYEFFNLPKYERNGASVQYEVEEVWVDRQTGEALDKATIKTEYEGLYELIQQYNVSYKETKYETTADHAFDNQEISVSNRLTGTKDVLWHKQWKDDYAFRTNSRPDIYLDIYKTNHVKDANGDVTEEVSVYKTNYRWTYSSLDPEYDPDGKYDKKIHWHAELQDLPKYDSLGYEIFYFAVERSEILTTNFDYTAVQYGYPVTDPMGGPTEIGTEYDIPSEYVQHVRDVSDIAVEDPETKDNTPHYALKESGTFTNLLSAEVTIKGQKLWKSLPLKYPAIDLPTVDFKLYRQLKYGQEDTGSKGDDQTGQDKDETDVRENPQREEVASIRVSDWAAINKNGTYIFDVLYEGVNTMNVNPDTHEVTISGEPGAKRLPKYDEDGRLYEYILEEEDIIFEDHIYASVEDVFKDATVSAYVIENNYDSVKGAASIKKYLELPLNDQGTPEAYPNVLFQLVRTYETSEKTTSDPELVKYVRWSSEDIKKAYEESDKDGMVSTVLSFEDLEIYAPNGSEYTYSVKEVKTYLGGYDTWGVSGDLAKDQVAGAKIDQNRLGDEQLLEIQKLTKNQDDGRGETSETLPVSATFINAFQKDNRETVSLEGKKIWDDYNNYFGARPDITLTVSRYANPFPGDTNNVKEQTVSKDSYEVVWQNNGEKEDEWSYTIKGITENELEKYAPNGMPWEYVVTEKLDKTNGYVASPSRVGEKSQIDDVITMNNLKNALNTQVPYSKSWVDAAGNLITGDYLGMELSVTFQLQVGEKDENGEVTNWWSVEAGQSFADYFKNNLSDVSLATLFPEGIDNLNTTVTKTGYINDDSVWGVQFRFENLPAAIKKDKNGLVSEMTELIYRVVETNISYGEVSQDFTVSDRTDGKSYIYGTNGGLFTPAYWPDGKNQGKKEFNYHTTRNLYNELLTSKLVVTKVWEDDHNNIYGTRPLATVAGQDWETHFVVQRTTDPVGENSQWENVKAHNGTEEKDLVISIYGTNDEDIVSKEVIGLPKQSADGQQTYTYRAVELKEGYETQPDGSIDTSQLVYEGQIFHEAYTVTYQSDHNGNVTVTNEMKNRSKVYAVKNWLPLPKAGTTVRLELKYKATNGTWKSFPTAAYVTLNGEKDTAPSKPYYEYEEWKAVWEDIPEVMPDSLLVNGKTQYTVTESQPAGYVLESNVEGTHQGYPEFTLNNVKSGAFTVQKQWIGVPTEQQQNVVVGLWRTTGEIGDAQSQKVLNANGTQRTATLTKENGWTQKFTGLPETDAQNKPYTYYAREITIGGKPVEETQFFVYHEDTGASTLIKNIGDTEIEGTKTWDDSSNMYGTRPEQVTLVLWRSVNGGVEEKVQAEPTWKKTEQNVWEYQYIGLPSHDSAGQPYTYRVEEVNVNGDYVPSYTDPYNIVNMLDRKIEIPVTKVWSGVAEKDWKEVTVGLYRTTAAGQTPEAVLGANGQMTVTLNDKNHWSDTFTGLPRFDGNGNRYIYSVQELMIDGKPAANSGYIIQISASGTGFMISNIKPSGGGGDYTRDIPVTKIWSDNGNQSGIRPTSIEVILFANGVEVKRAVLNGTGSVWSYTFTGLPIYDGAGNFITYTIKENVTSSSYDVNYNGYTITNTLKKVENGGLTVTKDVTGSGGDTDKNFHFTVYLSDTSVNGTYGQMLFRDGVATFTLKDGQSMEATGLPANVTYHVVEKEANKNGYDTIATGDVGMIRAGTLSEVFFENNKESQTPYEEEDPPIDTDKPSEPTDTPKTGDNRDLIFWFSILGMTVSCLGGILLFDRSYRRRSMKNK